MGTPKTREAKFIIATSCAVYFIEKTIPFHYRPSPPPQLAMNEMRLSVRAALLAQAYEAQQ